MQTRDTSKLIAYTLELERENRELKARLNQSKAEVERLCQLRIKDREIAADCRARLEKKSCLDLIAQTLTCC